MKALTDEEVADRAGKWARLHRKPETRGRMDACLEGLSQADQRRVYLCGQRLSGGLPLKVLPAAASNQEQKGGQHGKAKPPRPPAKRPGQGRGTHGTDKST